MTSDEHAHMQELEGLVKRYRSKIVEMKGAAVSDIKREMTLGEIVAALPEGHRAKQELKALREAASRLAEGTREELSPGPTVRDVESVYGISAAERPAPTWQPMESAPKDGSAVLGFGIHSGPQPDAQRGVKAGDHWWAIMLWDVWRNPDSAGWGERSLWVFAKDGKPTWSRPTHWMPLPAAPRSVVAPEKE